MAMSGMSLLLALLVLPGSAWAQSSLPDPTRTPGRVNPMVTQDNIGTTICRRGWTRTMRPPEAVTENLKRAQVAAFGYVDRRLPDYEEDHLIPLELGGAPDDPANLWPQPRHPADGWGAALKDRLERRLHFLVCHGRLSLRVAQHAIAQNWEEAYVLFMPGRGP